MTESLWILSSVVYILEINKALLLLRPKNAEVLGVNTSGQNDKHEAIIKATAADVVTSYILKINYSNIESENEVGIGKRNFP